MHTNSNSERPLETEAGGLASARAALVMAAAFAAELKAGCAPRRAQMPELLPAVWVQTLVPGVEKWAGWRMERAAKWPPPQ